MVDKFFCGLLGVFSILLILVLVVSFDSSMDDQETTTQELVSFSDFCYQDDVHEFIDFDTGVHYLVFCGYRKGGITPRLNLDGSVMVDEVKGGDVDGNCNDD